MIENSNKAIAINTIILYVRLCLRAVCGLLVSRFALQALGVNDYGLFAVVGSVISFITIINTIMLSTSNRFIAVAIGRGDPIEVNQQFNVNLTIHIVIAILVMIVAIPLGDWYINHFVNYQGNINSIIRVYHITVWGSVISFISVPYNGLLMAKERFIVFCSTDIIVHIIEVLICYSLIYHFVDKLMVYAVTKTVLAAVPTFVYSFYCTIAFKDYVRIKLVKDKKKYKSVFDFSVWVGYGALASVGKSQGSALIVNAFFDTVMNTALGLANSVNTVLVLFSENISSSIAPQITKAYAIGNKERAISLTCFSSRIAFMCMLVLSSPILLTPYFCFTLWLGNVPEYVVSFAQLLVIDALIDTLSRGTSELVFATGNIRGYQLIVNSLLLLSVVAAFFVLRSGFPAYSIIVTYIVFSLVAFFVRQIVLNKVYHISNWRIIRESFIPSAVMVLLYLPFVLFHPNWNPIVLNALSLGYLSVLCFCIGLKKAERKRVLRYIHHLVKTGDCHLIN